MSILGIPTRRRRILYNRERVTASECIIRTAGAAKSNLRLINKHVVSKTDIPGVVSKLR